MIQMFAAAIAPTPTPAPTQCPDIKPRPAAAKGTNACTPNSFHDVLRATEADGRSTGHAVEADSPSDTAAESNAAPSARAPGREPAPKSRRCDDPATAAAELLASLTAAVAETTATVEPVLATPTEAEPTPADPEATGDSLLDLIGRIKAAIDETANGREGAARVADLLQRIDLQAAELPPEALPGRIHQALRDLREHLSGIAWGQAAKSAATSPESAPPSGSAPVVDIPGRDTVQADTTAAALTPDGPVPPTAAAPGTPPALFGDHLRPLSRSLADRRTLNERAAASVRTEGDESAEPSAPARSTPVRPADAVQAKGPTVPAVPPTAESVPAPIENRPAEASTDTRANREPPPALKTAAVEAPTTEPNPGAGPDPLSADGRGLRPHETRADRPAESSSAGRDRETAGVNRSGVFDQIVQRAVLQVRNDQSEIKIDLKPDFLGNVRMQIVAEQQQVSVRIVTDTPVVRDMIETGLQQLRSDLQNQGLQVDRIEVSVSDGYRDPRQRQGWDGEPSKGERAEGIDTAARTGAAERSEPMAYRSVGSARRSNVDMFV